MPKFVVRTLAFCRKELTSSARQPLKVLSLVLGPFIILAIFATGYVGKNKFDTALVVPQREGVSTKLEDYASFSKDTFSIVEVSTNRQASVDKLKDGKLGAVIVVPDDAIDQIYNGKSAEFPVYYRQLSPLQANYIEYSTYVYASEFDKVIMRESLKAARPQTDQLKDYTGQINASTDRLQSAMQSNNLPAAKVEVTRLQATTALGKQATASLIIPGAGAGNTQESKLIAQKVSQGVVGNLTARVDAIDKQVQVINDGLNRNDVNSSQQQANLAKLREDNNALATDANKIANIPPAVLVSPVLSKAQNLTSTQASFVNFYAPAVVILLLQHIGVTLTALSIVRDRMLGALEIFRVAPINPTEILIGKFLSYMILLMIVSGLLLAALNFFLGVPFIGCDARVIDPLTLQEVPQGEQGEIVMRGPQVFKGYWKRPEATAEAFFQLDGHVFFRSGDLGRVDEDGYFFITDRLKRMINASGFKVWPAEVEALMFKHPGVQEACIISTQDSYRGESVKALVVLRAAAKGITTADDIIDWCKANMAAYKYPRVVEFVDVLPKSGAGKVMWRALQEAETARLKQGLD